MHSSLCLSLLSKQLHFRDADSLRPTGQVHVMEYAVQGGQGWGWGVRAPLGRP